MTKNHIYIYKMFKESNIFYRHNLWKNIWNNYCDTIVKKDINERIILKQIVSEIHKYI